MVSETMDDDMPSPGLADAFAFALVFGRPLAVDRLATGGVRRVVPVTGGSAIGRRLSGRITGGREALLTRGDGVTTVETEYWIETADGTAIRALGTGFATEEAGMQLSIAFEVAQDSPHAWLATRAFLAQRGSDGGALAVAEIV